MLLPEPAFDTIHDETRFRRNDVHKAKVFSAIHANPGISRNGIAKRHGIRPSTVSVLVSELISDKVVLEISGQRPNNVEGRPEIQLVHHKNRFGLLGVSFVSRKMRCVLLNMDYEPLMSSSIELPQDATNDDFFRVALELLKSIIKLKPGDCEVIGVNISVPGLIRLTPRTWVYSARWPNISNFFVDRLQDELGLPIRFKRSLDAHLDYLLSVHPQYSDGGVLLFHWGFGIGAAYAHNGVVAGSTRGSFLEIGHFRYDSRHDDPCVCGGKGCIETRAALWALAPRFRQLYGVFIEDEEEFARSDILSSVLETELFAEAVREVSRAIANLYVLLYPDRFLLYGPFTTFPTVRQRIRDHVLAQLPAFSADYFEVESVHVESNAEVIGIAREVFTNAIRPYLRAR